MASRWVFDLSEAHQAGVYWLRGSSASSRRVRLMPRQPGAGGGHVAGGGGQGGPGPWPQPLPLTDDLQSMIVDDWLRVAEKGACRPEATTATLQ